MEDCISNRMYCDAILNGNAIYYSIVVRLSRDCGDSTAQLPDCLLVQMT